MTPSRRPVFSQPDRGCAAQDLERNPEEGLQNLEELRQLTRALAEMRTMLLEMRPKL